MKKKNELKIPKRENQMCKPKYPEIEVDLVGNDGNAYVIIARVSNALRRANVPDKEIIEFKIEAKSGDYNHLLQTCMKWVEVS